MSTFGDLLRRLRREQDYSLRTVAKKLGTQKGYLSGIENGKVNPPSAKLVKRIAQLYRQDERMLLRLAWADKAPSLIREDAVRMVNHAELEEETSPDLVSVRLINPEGQPYPAELGADGTPRSTGNARLVLPRSRPAPDFAVMITDDSMNRVEFPRYRRDDGTTGLRHNHTDAGLGLPQMAVMAAAPLWKDHDYVARFDQGDRFAERLTVKSSQPQRNPSQPLQDAVQYRDRKQVTASEIPRSTSHSATEQRNIQIARVVGGNQHTAGLRNLPLHPVPKADPADDPRHNPQQSVDKSAHDAADTAATICETTSSTLRAEVSICRASAAGTKGATGRLRSLESLPDRS